MSNMGDGVSPAMSAAVAVAERAGFRVDDPQVVADSNHTIVWLAPLEVVAKVGRPGAEAFLLREHAIGSALARLGAPIAPPLPDVIPTRDTATGLLVSLWQRLGRGGEGDADPDAVGTSLRAVHGALAVYAGELPSLRAKLEAAQATLSDDRRMRALRPGSRRFLRDAFASLAAELDTRRYMAQPLHGEPHRGNRLTTEAGVRWIDFEGACTGPLEWDLAFLSPRSLRAFRAPDESLLELLRALVSARTAILCWERYDVAALRPHAEYHFEQVRCRLAGT